MDFIALAQQCAPSVHPQTLRAVAHVESSFNPFAIGVVGGRLARQPANKAEAVATAKDLEAKGFNFSLGVAQVNRYNLAKYGLDYEKAFEPCANMGAGAAILKDCYDRALVRFKNEQQALRASFSCYYSGNFKTGFVPDFKGQPSYVDKVLRSAGVAAPSAAPAAAPIPVFAEKQAPARVQLARNDGPVMVQAEQAEAATRSTSTSVFGGATSNRVMVFR